MPWGAIRVSLWYIYNNFKKSNSMSSLIRFIARILFVAVLFHSAYHKIMFPDEFKGDIAKGYGRINSLLNHYGISHLPSEAEVKNPIKCSFPARLHSQPNLLAWLKHSSLHLYWLQTGEEASWLSSTMSSGESSTLLCSTCRMLTTKLLLKGKNS